ncbi:MAG: PAS domain-containing protein [Bacteroidetes bacterium]|nr:PAS domain-containing protein [Bacteroidota bacterium]
MDNSIEKFNQLGLFVADHIEAMLAYWDKDQVCRFANLAYREWFGKSKEEMVNKMTLEELLGPLYIKNLPYVTEVLKGNAQQFQRQIKNPKGQVKHSLANYYPDVHEGSVRGFFVHVAEITKQKEAEEQLVQVNKELEAFSYTVAHDLRTPLRSVHGYAAMMEEDYGQILDAEGKRILGNIKQSASKMGQMIDDLLAFSRLGRKEIHLAEVNMAALTEQAVAEINHLTPHHARIVVGNLPAVMGDYNLLYQVMINLISNAVKYSSKSEQPVIEITAEEKSGEILFSVKDNGVGFDIKYVDKLFGVFQRLHNENEFHGHGIGLAFVHRIIMKHGGKIWAEGKVDKGATFCFTLVKR